LLSNSACATTAGEPQGVVCFVPGREPGSGAVAGGGGTAEHGARRHLHHHHVIFAAAHQPKTNTNVHDKCRTRSRQLTGTLMMMRHMTHAGDDEAHNTVTTADDDTFEDDEAARARLLSATHDMNDAAGARTSCPWMPGSVPHRLGALKTGRGLEPRVPGACLSDGRGALVGRRPPSELPLNLLATCTHAHYENTSQECECGVLDARQSLLHKPDLTTAMHLPRHRISFNSRNEVLKCG
jgi:hypothetical protein